MLDPNRKPTPKAQIIELNLFGFLEFALAIIDRQGIEPPPTNASDVLDILAELSDLSGLSKLFGVNSASSLDYSQKVLIFSRLIFPHCEVRAAYDGNGIMIRLNVDNDGKAL